MTARSRITRLYLLVVSCSLLVAFQTVFKSGVHLVHLDVSVLDRDRKPVRGLTAADFTVLEDGKPQKIAAFAAVDVPAPPPVTAPWMRSVAPDVRTNEHVNNPEGRLIVVLLDDAMIPFDPFAIKSAKAAARKVIDQIGPADRVAVVFSAGSAGHAELHERSRAPAGSGRDAEPQLRDAHAGVGDSAARCRGRWSRRAATGAYRRRRHRLPDGLDDDTAECRGVAHRRAGAAQTAGVRQSRHHR